MFMGKGFMMKTLLLIGLLFIASICHAQLMVTSPEQGSQGLSYFDSRIPMVPSTTTDQPHPDQWSQSLDDIQLDEFIMPMINDPSNNLYKDFQKQTVPKQGSY